MNAISSLPVRGAWIEILSTGYYVLGIMSLPVRGAWIEIANIVDADNEDLGSLPVRGAWIEIV